MNTNKYENSKIYQIIDLNTGELYIGSTTQTLARRLAGHVNSHKQYKKRKAGYITSFKIIEGGNYRIELLEKYNCASKDELHAKEGQYIRNIGCLNRCDLSNETYYIKNNKLVQRKNYFDEIRKLKYICTCGSIIRKGLESEHNKTKKHINDVYKNITQMYNSIVDCEYRLNKVKY